MPRGPFIIKAIYFYLVSFVALLMIVLPSANLLNLIVRHVIFQVGSYDYYPSRPMVAPEDSKQPPIDEKEEKERFEKQQINQVKRDVARDISFLVVGVPLFIFNWRLIRRNKVSE